MIVNGAEKFDAEANLTGAKAREFIGRLLQALAAWARKLK